MAPIGGGWWAGDPNEEIAWGVFFSASQRLTSPRYRLPGPKRNKL
jgi:hypothetical protein